MPARRVFGEIRGTRILIRSYNFPHMVRKNYHLNAINFYRVISLISSINHSQRYDEINLRIREHLDSLPSDNGDKYHPSFLPVNEEIPTIIRDSFGNRIWPVT